MADLAGVHAPDAPGRLGERIDPAELQTYLAQLETWVRGRRAELDEIDDASRRSPRAAQVEGDVVLSMALWKSVSDRYAELVTVFDGGRVGPTEREKLSSLIWGRLDATTGGDAGSGRPVAVSVPEACSLSDALASSLRAALGLSPALEESMRRVRALRAQLERLRDQVALEPGDTQATAQRRLTALVTRTDDVTAKLERGGDIDGLLGPLEADAARTERDLIVGSAQRRDVADRRAGAAVRYDALESQGRAVRAIADEATAAVTPAPIFAVPDVSLLGPPPVDGAALSAYAERLVRVGQALDLAQAHYQGALDERQELLDRLEAYAAKAAALGVADDPDAHAAYERAWEILERRPAPLSVATPLVAVYAAWVDLLAAPTRPSERGRS